MKSADQAPRAANTSTATPSKLKARKFNISPDQVDAGAVSVVEALVAAGYEALLVGGCVRDLLLGLTPKDFDVATSATPDQVKQVFRKARLIGRRFQIAHVRAGRNIIEVSTFRRQAGDEDEVEGDARQSRSAQGMLLRDNLWGNLSEDAFRRDFTVNALYYNPLDETIIDYTGGVQDLQAKRLRLIGDPGTRYREDPVRILRALRFASKLDFELAPETAAGISATVHLIGDVAPARLFDEVCKLFLHGHALRAWELLLEWDLLGYLFPDIDPAPHTQELIAAAMRGTDTRIAEDRPVTPGFLLAVMLWDLYLEQLDKQLATAPPAQARDAAASNAIGFQSEITSIPKRISQFVREVWELQPRLEARPAKGMDKLVTHPRFRAAYDFLLLRAETGELPLALAQWWTDYQAADEAGRARLREALPKPKGGNGNKRKRRRRSGPAPGPAATS